jgi:3-hydroxyacyl-CoA dehydrogenase
MQIKRAAVIGGGAMGGSIAHLLTAIGIECFVKDIDQKFVDKAIDLSKGIYDKLVKKGKMDQKKADDLQNLLHGSVEYDKEYFSDHETQAEHIC